MHAPATLAAVAAMASLTTALPSHIKRSRFPQSFGPRPAIPANHTAGHPGSIDVDAGDFYSTNWAGIIQAPASGESFTSAVGTVSVPTCSQGAGSGSSWYNALWVGIDGYTNSNALLQAGVICEYDAGGATTYTPWVEYFPDPLITLDGFPVSAGDEITIEITVTSGTTGTIAISDATTGQSTTTAMSAPAATNILTGSSAEWIMEDFSSGNSLVPFAAFSPCTWTASTGSYADGGVLDASAGDYTNSILENSSGTPITSTSGNGGDSLTITYTG